jgi:hypothetical protein
MAEGDLRERSSGERILSEPACRVSPVLPIKLFDSLPHGRPIQQAL